MFNLDPGKLLVIAVVAIILLGPDKLPQVARQAGNAWRSFNEFRHRMESEVRNTMPDLPPTSEIARLARSPSALLNHLSTMSSESDGGDGSAGDGSAGDGAPAAAAANGAGGANGAHGSGDGQDASGADGVQTAAPAPDGSFQAPSFGGAGAPDLTVPAREAAPGTPSPGGRPTAAPAARPAEPIAPGDPTLN